MGFLDRKSEELAIKYIAEFTGQYVVPEVCVPCESSHDPGWRGYCVLTDSGIFLVNKYGARGVAYQNIGGTDSWGQYPRGTRGYPKYRFSFLFNSGVGGFTVTSLTEDAGLQLERYLNSIYTPNA